MKQFKYHVRFTTPAFLGNAEQSGQWRTPPIKALLRQWWRVVWAADLGFQVGAAAQATMRREEGLLLGHAWLENDRNKQGDTIAARKSLVRIRLDRWDGGTETKAKWGQQELERNWKVPHPEVPAPVGPLLYLGYGPLEVERVQRPGQNRPDYATALKKNAAIQAGESAMLSIAVPSKHSDPEFARLLKDNTPRIERALWLLDRYGTLGGRSRNGWGSFSLLPLPSGEGRGEGKPLAGSTPLRFWQDCLNLDWPHAIGTDGEGRPLIWQTQPFADWKALMKQLAIVKIGLRTQKSSLEFVLNKDLGDKQLFNKKNEETGILHGQPQQRHWLSYPVTNHSVAAWGNNARLPNTLRFKVRATADKKLVGVIFHVPHLPPAAFRPNLQDIKTVWTQVHRFLDVPAQDLTRIPE